MNFLVATVRSTEITPVDNPQPFSWNNDCRVSCMNRSTSLKFDILRQFSSNEIDIDDQIHSSAYLPQSISKYVEQSFKMVGTRCIFCQQDHTEAHDNRDRS